ncbi:LPS-assembly lipoprotein LptE [Acinetobacter tianfuensis]|uniref:LPS-assembly lipoprotein LptE n=1 Tax=Acinetobacter tianfuensis TaxID=2419603 RepID=A0A3A8EGJ2_9GAMM|nr:LPS assembly lipoprotein LptE [Acinetobacter tianfuensis]RKG33238.1 hypothetical protein D7V32_03695 [Acinetobacter tianfuensis]
MHLVQRVAAIVLTLGLSAGLTGCGFYLKGTNPNVAPVTYANMSLVLPQNTENLEEKLKIYLGAAGVTISNDANSYVLRVLDYTPRRLELNGKLVETLLRLNVTFRIEDAQGNPVTEPRTLMATRSYQYDVATVNTDDQEQKYLNNVIVDDIAQQIARQISSNRLPPAVQKTQAPVALTAPVPAAE